MSNTPPAKQTFAQFLALLEQADAVIADGSPLLTSWDAEEVTGDGENQVVRFSWIDDEGLGYSITLTEEEIANGSWVGTSFFCLDAEGDETQFTLYRTAPIVPPPLMRRDAETQYKQTCNQQGWNQDSQILHLEGFIREKGLFAELAAYAKQAAEEENNTSIDLG